MPPAAAAGAQTAQQWRPPKLAWAVDSRSRLPGPPYSGVYAAPGAPPAAPLARAAPRSQGLRRLAVEAACLPPSVALPRSLRASPPAVVPPAALQRGRPRRRPSRVRPLAPRTWSPLSPVPLHLRPICASVCSAAAAAAAAATAAAVVRTGRLRSCCCWPGSCCHPSAGAPLRCSAADRRSLEAG